MYYVGPWSAWYAHGPPFMYGATSVRACLCMHVRAWAALRCAYRSRFVLISLAPSNCLSFSVFVYMCMVDSVVSRIVCVRMCAYVRVC